MSARSSAARDKATIKKLVDLGKATVSEINRSRNPHLKLPVRALSNVSFNPRKSIIELGKQKQERYFFNVAQARKFMQTYLTANACKELVESKKTTSIRDLYYIMKHTLGSSKQNTFEEQEESDPIIEDLEVTTDALREELHLFASNKGALVGEITIVDSGDTIDGRRMGSGGWSVPSIVEDNVVQLKKNNAKFILLVEKDAVWRRLNEDKFWRKHECILIHGGGQPPRGVRRLCRRMVSELKIPMYVLVDNDPWGFYIYSVVKQGSINLAYESVRMAVPEAKFIGLSSFDQDKYKLTDNVTMRLDDGDAKRANQMLKYPWFQKKEWQKEIRHMLKRGKKLEIEALSSRGISFITDVYLPKKIRTKDWLN